jgi:hypothetical protein
MATTTIERSCSACNGTGGAGGKTSIGVSELITGSGFCSVCKGKGKIFETVYIREQPAPAPSRPSYSSSGSGEQAIGGFLALFLIITAFLLAISLILAYALLKALFRMLTKNELGNTAKLLIVLMLLGVVYGIGVLTVDPASVFSLVNLDDVIPVIPSPWNYTFAILGVIPLFALFLGQVMYKWLSASWHSTKVLLGTLFEGIGEGWSFLASFF